MKKKLIFSAVGLLLLIVLSKATIDIVFSTACAEQNTRVIKNMVALGANMEDKERGRTALMFAVEANEIETARTLLDLGANPNAENTEGITPLAVAEGEGFSEIAKLLREHGGKI